MSTRKNVGIFTIAFYSLLTFSTDALSEAKGQAQNNQSPILKQAQASRYFEAPKNRAIKDQYIVVLKESYLLREAKKISKRTLSSLSKQSQNKYRKQAMKHLSQQMTSRYGAVVNHQYDRVLSGYAVKMSSWEMENMLLSEDGVAYIEQDQIMTASDIQFDATFGLDRIDQPNLPLDGQYEFNLSGSGVDVYIVDTGILDSHFDFNNRVDVERGFTAIEDGRGTGDCQGHGTHVAGTVGSQTFGVAKNVNLIPIRVLNCAGRGSNSGIIAGVNFITQTANGPSVANMSLNGPVSRALDTAIRNSVESGVTYTVSTGNEAVDACNNSPGRLAEVITVGSTDTQDNRSDFSNFGRCVDIFAPGSDVTSTFNNGRFLTLSGTSMASPHVAGVAALALEAEPKATPREVFSTLQTSAISNKIGDTKGSPNLLLQTKLRLDSPISNPAPIADGCFYQATFESDSDGWTTSGSCSTGEFTQGTPNQSVTGDITLQVAGAAVGQGAWFTQPNSSLGANDVDGGSCITESPVIDGSSASDVNISLRYFHGQRDTGDDASDGFNIEVFNNGTLVETLVAHGDERVTAEWTRLSTHIANPGKIQIKVQAIDGPAFGDILEGGIDEVLICPGE